MGEDRERAARIVVAEGILSAEEARALAREPGPDLLDRLRADGRISGQTFASLRARLVGAADPAPASGPTGPGDTDGGGDLRAARDPDAFPVPGWDRYEPIRPLGQGGMGRVFLATDLRLGRQVAIKFVRGDDPQLARRILAEARAQARVNDTRVCKVYEVGEVRGRVYIAMQYIAGRSLAELAGELSFEQKALAVRGAALGVAEAHRVGLIHRDLKPSNIMLERMLDGELRPYVMDFGVARDWVSGAANAATMTGAVLGTPQFMAPEQARGEVTQLDRRADVYSLGATLYALLTGRPPLDAANPLAVLTRVATDEPVRPRAIDPDVPADLEAIALKCLEKERAARYDSARALADDLGRFLAGEPVAARVADGPGYRLRKWVRRRARRVVAVASVAIVLAVALGLALHERRRAAQREALARRFTERVERIEALARYAALAPAHEIRADRARIRVAMDALSAEVRDGGELAAGPGRYALGRGHLALGDDDAAAVELAAARQHGYREPRVAYALALAEGHRYQRGLREIERLPREQREDARRAVEQRHRDPALAALRGSIGADVPSLAYVAALVAYYEARFDDALARLDTIDADGGAGLAWFYEAPLLRGEILHARAMARRGSAAPAQTAADLSAARRAFAAAASIGRSDPAVHLAQGELEASALQLEIYGGGAVAGPFERGVAAADLALAIAPDQLAALGLRVALRRQLAEYRGNRGEDVTALLTAAAADARRAVELAPARSDARLALARVYRQWGDVRLARGEDPTSQLRMAIGIAEAIAPADRDYDAEVVIGLGHKVWADYQDQIGEDADLHRSQAIAAYLAAIAKNDRRSSAWLNLGINHYARGAQPRRPAAAAEADLGEALAAIDRGRALDPGSFVPWFYQGEIFAQLARRKQARGADPAPDWSRALDAYRQGLAINPRLPHLHNGISLVQVQQARDAADHGRDPLPLLAAAQAAAAQAVAVAPDQGHGYNNVGDVLAQRAAYQRARGEDPRPAAREAIRAFGQALERIPTEPTFLRNLAAIHHLVAAYELDHALDPRAHLALAQQRIDQALARDPTQAEAKRLRAELAGLAARWPVRRARAGQAAPP